MRANFPPSGAVGPLVALLLLVACSADRAASPPVVHVESGAEAGARLTALLDTLRGPARVVLAPGRYVLEPTPYTDPSCGNCRDSTETVPATRGLRLSGSGVVVEGGDPDGVVLETRSGYGVLFEGCDGCALRGVTVTGGTRDPDGRATDAAVVVRDGRVLVEECALRDNLGDSAVVQSVVVGIAGAVVREGGDLTLRRCRVERNSWDGVALYRGARALVEENVIDGVDAAVGGRHGGGRGVGVGVTWNARATVVGNRITRYWKGIGIFVDARGEVRENLVHDVVTWGLAYWAAGEGHPVARFQGNAVAGAGSCGALVEGSTAPEAGEAPGGLVGNAFVRTGSNEAYDSGELYCPQRPIARVAVPAGFEIEGNTAWDVRLPGPWPAEAVAESRDAFMEKARPILDALQAHPPLRRTAEIVSGG